MKSTSTHRRRFYRASCVQRGIPMAPPPPPSDCPRLSDFIDFISVKRGRLSIVINSCSRRRIPLSHLVASDRLRDAYYTFRQRRRVAIASIFGSANPRIRKLMRPNVGGSFTSTEFFRPNRPLPDVVLLQRDRATPSDHGVFLQRDRAMESTSRQLVVDCFATILTAAQNFLSTIWPIDIL